MEEPRVRSERNVVLGLDMSHVVTVESSKPQEFDVPFQTFSGGKTQLLTHGRKDGQVLALDSRNLNVVMDSGEERVVGIQGGQVATRSEMIDGGIRRPQIAIQATEGKALKVRPVTMETTMVRKLSAPPREFKAVEPNMMGEKTSGPCMLDVGDNLEFKLGGARAGLVLGVRVDKSGPVLVVDEHDGITQPFRRDPEDKDLYTLTVGRHEGSGNDYTFPDVKAYQSISRKHARITARVVGDGSRSIVVVDNVSKANAVQYRGVSK